MKARIKIPFRKEVLQRKAYTLKPYPKAIKLNQNELPYDLPPQFKKELFQRLQRLPFQIYPQTQPERLKKELAKFLRVSAEQLLICNGSNVMIQALVLATAVRGKVLIVDPSFSLFEAEGELLGNRVIRVPLREPDFSFPLEIFLKTMKREKPDVIFISNPNAPLGNLFPKKDLLRVIAQARCLVVLDEAYFQFSGLTLLPLIKKFPNLAVLRTFSKGFGLGGVRIGYLVAREQVIHEVRKVLLPYCTSVLSEETALLVLKHASHFHKIIREVLSERERVYRAMLKMNLLQVFPSKTNFILFRVRDPQECFQHLLSKGVLIRDMSKLPRLNGCLRVSIGKPRENDAFLKALGSYRPPPSS